jgi:threonine synthase
MWRGIIEEFREFLPVSAKTPIVTLLEGNTPLIEAKKISASLGAEFQVYLKYEGLNPTGSFKDRGMTMAISKAKEEGAKAVICASTGNTSSAAAAYSARAGLQCVVLVPAASIALGKLAQSLIHGAKVLAVEGLFDDTFRLVGQLRDKYKLTMVNSVNPYRLEGQKTGAMEICNQLGEAPDFHSIPVGNAGNIVAYWNGYKQYKEAKRSKALPKMLGFQAEGADPIVQGRVIQTPQTVATAIRIGNPANWKTAEKAAKDSSGLIDSVSDKEILEAYKALADTEGVFCEAASATSIAGLIKLKKNGYFRDLGKKGPIRVVCTLTGHGLKDPDRALSMVGKPINVKARIEDVIEALGYKVTK